MREGIKAANCGSKLLIAHERLGNEVCGGDIVVIVNAEQLYLIGRDSVISAFSAVYNSVCNENIRVGVAVGDSADVLRKSLRSYL